MARGSRIITFRIDDGLLEDVEIAVADRNERTKETPWNMTEFIRVALREKLAHMMRSRRSKRKKESGAT